MAHRFQAGQSVSFSGGYPYRDAADGLYRIIQQLPTREGDYQYRIKSEREEFERVVTESELEET
jgi:hypothetical protein